MILRTLGEAIEDITSAGADAEDGEVGYYGNRTGPGWLVYERKDESCTVCGTPIRRLRQAGRSTYFCPVCQRR
jgi:formamidopyrimidine-DNA glycosylase